MKCIEALKNLLGSKTLTVWLAGIFVVYYLTVAVWSREAFAQFIMHLSGSNMVRLLYALFVTNVFLRIIRDIRDLRGHACTLALRMPLYAGLLAFLCASFLSVNFRKMMWHDPVGQGDTVTVVWDNATFTVAEIKSALKDKTLRQSDAAVFDYEPGVTLVDKSGNKHAVGAFPPRLVGSHYMHVLQFGIKPGMELKQGNEVLVRQYIPLRLVPLGSVDSFHIEPLPYQFYMTVLPNRIIKKGRESGEEYDLTKPLYRMDIKTGDQLVKRVETDAGFSFGKNMSITFLQPMDWVVLEIVHDPFLPFFAGGLFLLAAGIVLYPFSYLCSRPAGK